MKATHVHPQSLDPGLYAGLVIVAAFIATRVLFYGLGGRFISQPVGFALQYLDPQLLQNDLLQSLLYLHTQPPLFNLFLGVVLKISADPPLTFALLFQTAGLMALLALCGLLRAVRLSPAAALIVSMIFMCNPTVILYENLLYYTYIEGALILLAAFSLLQWCRCWQSRWALSFWLALGCLGGIRSLFHPVFFVGLSCVLGFYFFIKNRRRKQVLVFCAASLLAIAPLLLVCSKNKAVFGFFGNSSWDGISLWTKACGYGPEELEQLYSRGIISSLARQAELEPFRALAKYTDGDMLMARACHHPADCAQFKTTGKPNFNHIGYIELSRQLWKDALAIIRDDPARFAFQTLASYSLTLWYASDSVHGLFKNNMEILANPEKMYRYACLGFLGVQNRHSDSRQWVRTAYISILLLLFYAGTTVLVVRAREDREIAVAAVCFFCMLIHAYTIAVSSIIEFGENNRFRFPVDGAFLVLMAGNMAAFLPLLRRRKSCLPAGLGIPWRQKQYSL
jgi:hypothetical protein